MLETAKVSPSVGLVTVKKASELIGLSEKAIRRKREDGVWREGKEIEVGPDGRVYVNLKEFEQWVIGK